MADDLDLSPHEHQVLAAAAMMPLKAYGVAIRELIQTETSSAPSLGTIYATLERLDNRGFLKARLGEATPERGGRRKLFYDLTGSGQTALRRSFARIDALRPAFSIGGGYLV